MENGNEREKLQKLYPNIQFTGWKNSGEVRKYMEGAKALIMPSRWYEAAPLTNIEALMLGIPALTSSCNAASEISNINNKSGFVFEENADSLKECILFYEKNTDDIDIEYAKEKIINERLNYVNNLIALYNKIREN